MSAAALLQGLRVGGMSCGSGGRVKKVSGDHQRRGEVLLRGVGTLRYSFPPNASVQWQPDVFTIHIKQWFLGARFLGALPISLRSRGSLPGERAKRGHARMRAHDGTPPFISGSGAIPRMVPKHTKFCFDETVVVCYE